MRGIGVCRLVAAIRGAGRRSLKTISHPRVSARLAGTSFWGILSFRATGAQPSGGARGFCTVLLKSSTPPLPAPGAIQAEIDTLRNWVETIKERQDKIDEI